MDDIPILDNHTHLDRRKGKGIEAVKEFNRSGGTHICLVNKPYWTLDIQPNRGEDWDKIFTETLQIAEKARDVVEGDVFTVLGVHPVGIDKLVERMKINTAEQIMKEALDLASKYIREKKAIALKSGRPHYEVSDEIFEASNKIMRYAFKLGSQLDCPVQLHTEYSTDLSDISNMAEEVGLSRKKVIKHYSPPELKDLTPSVIAKKDQLIKAIENDKSFMMETDYIDDPERPGAVLGPRNVPKKTLDLMDKGEYRESLYKAHQEIPNEVYNIEISL